MFSIPLDTKSKQPMYEQIYSYIKSEIIQENLAAGDKLPSTRSLASYLQVSRNTIDMAYGQLLSEGYIESYEKRGYFVNKLSGLKVSSDTDTLSPNRHDTKEIQTPSLPTYRYDFSPFAVDINHFPYHTWQKLMKECLYDHSNLFLLGENQGDINFREAIMRYIRQSRGVHCNVDQIIVGAGADYLLQLLSQLISKNVLIAMEDPTYKQAYQIFDGLHLPLTTVPVDEHGIDIIKLRQTEATIVYVTPSHQFPLGAVMPIHRRLALLAWAKENEQRYIIEDDHDSEFRYKGKPIPSLQGIDSDDKVIYMGTFSRSIAPAIRIAYMVLPKNLLDIYKNEYSYYSSTVSRLDQKILTTFIEDGYFERHLNRMRKRYKAKHDAMLLGLKPLRKQITILGEHAGLHLVVQLHTKRKEQEILALAEEQRMKLYPLSVHYIRLPETYQPTFLMGYANLSEEKITESIEAFVSFVHSLEY